MAGLCCLPWCRKPIPKKHKGRKFPPDRPTQLAWLDALDAGAWFSIPQETLSSGLVLCSDHFDSKGNIKRRYESPFVDTGTVEENKPACPSSEESDGDSNTNFNNDDGDADYSPPAVSRRSRRRSRRHCENVGDGPQKRKSTCSPRVTAKRKQIKVEIVEQSDSDHDSNDNETPLNLEDSCLTQPGPSGGMITILDSIDSGRLAKLTDEAIRNSKQEKPKVTRPAQRNSMSLLQKMEIIRLADKGLKQTQISRMLNVKKSTVCSQLAQREKIEEAFNAGCPAMKKKLRKGPYDDVNLALYAWYQKVTSQNLFVNSRVLLTMAENIAKELGRTDFKGSPSWMEGFKQRYNIRFTLNQYKPRKNSNKTKQESAGLHDSNLSEADEAQQSDASGVIDDDGGLNKPSDPRTQDWLTHTWSKLRIKNSKTQEMYQERDIFFAEELGILYRMTPKQAWQFRHNDATTIPDFTIADERITVLLCANADCSEKRRLLIIGKSNSGMTNNSPADYIVAKDPSNWITKSAFRHWLKTWNTSLESEKRKVILLLNSSPIHTLDAKTGVPNVKVVNIPTHHTKLLHPVHCGISKSFRSRYRRILLEKIVSGAYPETLDSQLAAFMLSTAWTEVPDQLIRGAFVQTGLISSSEVLTSSDEFDCANLLAKAAELGYAVSPSKWSFLDYVGIDDSLYAIECTILGLGSQTADEIADTTQSPGSEEAEDDDEETLCSGIDVALNHCNISTSDAQNHLENLRFWAMSRRSCPQVIHTAISTIESFILGHLQ